MHGGRAGTSALRLDPRYACVNRVVLLLPCRSICTSLLTFFMPQLCTALSLEFDRYAGVRVCWGGGRVLGGDSEYRNTAKALFLPYSEIGHKKWDLLKFGKIMLLSARFQATCAV